MDLYNYYNIRLSSERRNNEKRVHYDGEPVRFGRLRTAAGTPNPASTQYRIDYTQQWQLLAERTVEKLVRRVAAAPDVDFAGHVLGPAKVMPKPIGSRPYYIHTAAGDSSFAKAFTPLLQQELGKRGYTVSRTPHNALVVNYSVQTFYYGAPDKVRRPIDYATLSASAVALGYYIGNPYSAGAWIAKPVVASGIFDALYETGKVTRAEAVLTTSVVTDNHFVHHDSESLYVLPANLPFYRSQYPAGVPMETEAIGPVVEPERTFRVQAM